MIQEILGYLWTRSGLLYIPHDDMYSNIVKDKLLEEKVLRTSSEESFINHISRILNEEKEYFLLGDYVIDNTLNIINDIRFDSDSKKLKEKINNIIIELNTLKSLPKVSKGIYASNFCEQEKNLRKLPDYINNGQKNIVLLMECDLENFYRMIGILAGNMDIELDEKEILSYTSTFNLLLSNYPDFFDILDGDLSLLNSLTIFKKDKSDLVKNYLQETIDRYKKVVAEEKDLKYINI